MYNIKGSSKIVAKTTTRRGMTQNIENFKDYNKNKINECSENDPNNDPKPVFQRKCTMTNDKQKFLSPPHEEIVNFIYESWNSVCSEVEPDLAEGTEKRMKQSEPTAFYYEDEPCTLLQDFKPFDLESWWGRRLYAYVTSSANSNC